MHRKECWSWPAVYMQVKKDSYGRKSSDACIDPSTRTGVKRADARCGPSPCEKQCEKRKPTLDRTGHVTREDSDRLARDA
jgi:hypothetical protein